MKQRQSKNAIAGIAERRAKAAQNADEPPQLAESFSEESCAVRAMIEADAAASSPVTQAAQDAFSSVHSRLMNAIEEDMARTAPAWRNWALKLWKKFDQLSQSTFLFSRSASLATARYAVMIVLFFAVGLTGHRIGSLQGAQALPVQLLVDDFDLCLKSATPLEYVATDSNNAKPVAHWLSAQVGHKVLLPAPTRSGTRILGARHHELWGHSVAQAHYIKDGVRVALYQIHEPRAGLKGLQETEVNGRTYLATRRGNYHVVVWRKGDDIVTMVSPLKKVASLRLAAALREAAPKV
jgi:hypothetical protein